MSFWLEILFHTLLKIKPVAGRAASDRPSSSSTEMFQKYMTNTPGAGAEYIGILWEQRYLQRKKLIFIHRQSLKTDFPLQHFATSSEFKNQDKSYLVILCGWRIRQSWLCDIMSSCSQLERPNVLALYTPTVSHWVIYCPGNAEQCSSKISWLKNWGFRPENIECKN